MYGAFTKICFTIKHAREIYQAKEMCCDSFEKFQTFLLFCTVQLLGMCLPLQCECVSCIY